MGNSMPHQNRVTPRSEIIATSARGVFMGNRGILHDETRTIRRHYVGRRWIICVTEFKGRKLVVMKPGAYTQLFFLDEATALAAGHRPCAECQRERFHDFRRHWAHAHARLDPATLPSADTIDAALHRERISGDRWSGWQQVTYHEQLGSLPDGAFVALPHDPVAYLVCQGGLFPWSPEGYGKPSTRQADTVVQVLTPRSTVHTLHSGYQPVLHPSIQA